MNSELFDRNGLNKKDTMKRGEILNSVEGLEQERLREFSEKISKFIEKARLLKKENLQLRKRVGELEEIINRQTEEIENLKQERVLFRHEIEQIMRELEDLDL